MGGRKASVTKQRPARRRRISGDKLTIGGLRLVFLSAPVETIVKRPSISAWNISNAIRGSRWRSEVRVTGRRPLSLSLPTWLFARLVHPALAEMWQWLAEHSWGCPVEQTREHHREVRSLESWLRAR
jgi:hypothetical protein